MTDVEFFKNIFESTNIVTKSINPSIEFQSNVYSFKDVQNQLCELSKSNFNQVFPCLNKALDVVELKRHEKNIYKELLKQVKFTAAPKDKKKEFNPNSHYKIGYFIVDSSPKALLDPSTTRVQFANILDSETGNFRPTIKLNVPDVKPKSFGVITTNYGLIIKHGIQNLLELKNGTYIESKRKKLNQKPCVVIPRVYQSPNDFVINVLPIDINNTGRIAFNYYTESGRIGDVQIELLTFRVNNDPAAYFEVMNSSNENSCEVREDPLFKKKVKAGKINKIGLVAPSLKIDFTSFNLKSRNTTSAPNHKEFVVEFSMLDEFGETLCGKTLRISKSRGDKEDENDKNADVNENASAVFISARNRYSSDGVRFCMPGFRKFKGDEKKNVVIPRIYINDASGDMVFPENDFAFSIINHRVNAFLVQQERNQECKIVNGFDQTKLENYKIINQTTIELNEYLMLFVNAYSRGVLLYGSGSGNKTTQNDDGVTLQKYMELFNIIGDVLTDKNEIKNLVNKPKHELTHKIVKPLRKSGNTISMTIKLLMVKLLTFLLKNKNEDQHLSTIKEEVDEKPNVMQNIKVENDVEVKETLQRNEENDVKLLNRKRPYENIEDETSSFIETKKIKVENNIEANKTSTSKDAKLLKQTRLHENIIEDDTTNDTKKIKVEVKDEKN